MHIDPQHFETKMDVKDPGRLFKSELLRLAKSPKKIGLCVYFLFGGFPNISQHEAQTFCDIEAGKNPSMNKTKQNNITTLKSQ